MKPRVPLFSDGTDDHHDRSNNNSNNHEEELTPLMLLPRHAGKRTPPVPYYHYGDTPLNRSISSIGHVSSSASLKAAESRQDLPALLHQQELLVESNSSNSSSTSNPVAAVLFVAQIYSHRDGSSYIRYHQAAAAALDARSSSRSSSSSDDDNRIGNKKLRCRPWHYYSQQQRHGCILAWTLIFVIVLFVSAGRALFHKNASSTGSPGTPSYKSSDDERGSSSSSSSSVLQSPQQQQQHSHSRVPRCGSKGMPCFYPGRIQVQSRQRQADGAAGGGFPSYWDYAGPMDVTTQNDDRSMFLINDNRVLFLAGSMHPVRATKASWELALDEAVRNGLNLVTMDIFWSAHQPFRDSPFDWSMSSSQQPDWQLKDAMYSCASRGLFVHLRIIAASGDYSLGGIPEWLAVQYPNMKMEQMEDGVDWQAALFGFLKATIDYLTASQLWAAQGGPIIMAQVENELVNGGGGGVGGCSGSGSGDDDDDMADDFSRPQFAQHAPTTPTQVYAAWLCPIVASLSPTGVVWTMCNNRNGLSASSSNATSTRKGDSSRIQVYQPRLFTLNDGGFRQWGGGVQQAAAANMEAAWCRRKSAAGMSHAALQWFARGGAHLNYNMWWGGYNRGRSAAASTLNAHDTQAVLCPSGETHPQFAHFQDLHTALAEIAPILLHTPLSSLRGNREVAVQVMNDTGQWDVDDDQQTIMFVYQSNDHEAIFVENNLNAPVVARVPCCSVGGGGVSAAAAPPTMVVLEMQPHSSILLVDGMVRFDSGAIESQAMSYARRYIRQPVILLDWATWQEPVGVLASSLSSLSLKSSAALDVVHVDTRPLEQTALNMNDTVWSDYAWYQTTFTVENHLDMATLRVDTQKANGIVVFLDGKYIDAADNHERSQGPTSLYLSLGSLKSGTHQLALLSESFGYNTLTSITPNQNSGGTAQLKGITGDVVLSSPSLRHNMNLVDGRSNWLSFAGLHGERVSKDSSSSSSSAPPPMAGVVWREHLQNRLLPMGWGPISSTASWSAAYFDSPRYDPSTQGLYLHITSGRGHLWLNGHDLGRYWNITQSSIASGGGGGGGGAVGGNAAYYSQEYYFLPNDYLYGDSGKLNEIVLFDVFGGDHGQTELVLSWIEAASDDEPTILLMDQACLV